MRVLKNLAFLIFAFGAMGYAGYSLYLYQLGPCGRPLQYSIGQFDTRFGIKEEFFKSEIAKAEVVWEEAVGRDMFIYNPKADFKINLIYDTRQANTESKQKADFGLTAIEKSFNKVDAEFVALKNAYENQSKIYEQSKTRFEVAKAEYDAEVKYWNSRGGAPNKEFEDLDDKRQELNQMAQSLNTQAEDLNKMAEEVNRALLERNSAAALYNKVVKDYNKKFGHGLEFNQAEYTGRAINLFQFTNSNDLRLALAHEFGHALGMGHTENEKSLMYFESEEGSRSGLTPTEEDLVELHRVCSF